jgi:uncharacterized membrane protein
MKTAQLAFALSFRKDNRVYVFSKNHWLRRDVMSEPSEMQAKYTFWTVLIGIIFLLILSLVAIFAFRHSNNPAETIVAVLGAVTGVLGTLVGYVAGQAGKERADQRATRAERQLSAVIDRSGPGIYEQAKKAYPELFKE